MRYRLIALLFTSIVVLSVAACGSSSKSQTTSTAASPAVTQGTTASTPAPQSTATSAGGPNAAVCAEATKDLEPLQAAASTNNTSQIMAQAGQAASKLIALQNRPGISSQAHAALGELTGALEAFAHGARDRTTATHLTSGASNLAAACR